MSSVPRNGGKSKTDAKKNATESERKKAKPKKSAKEVQPDVLKKTEATIVYCARRK